MRSHKNRILLLCIGILFIVGVIYYEQVTAFSEQRGAGLSYPVYLPAISNNFDASLGTPVFGVQMYGNTSDSRSYHPFLLDSGAGWLRVNVSWASAEPVNVSPASFNWTSTDRNLSAARSDMGGLNLIVTVEDSPGWAAADSGSVIYPDKRDDFAEFVGALAERYDGDGIDDAPGSPIVLYWELFNEPDANDTQIPFRWGNDGAAYANMLAEVYPVAKAANPAVQIVMGGLAYDWFEEQGGPFVRNFLPDVLAAGGGAYFDVANFHYYPLFAPNWTDDSSLGLIEKAEDVRSVLATYGYVKPLVITEAGWHDNDVVGVPSTPEEQARYLIELFTESMAADLDATIWWMLYDPGGFYPYNNGIVTNDATLPIVKKLSFNAFQYGVAELQYAHFVRALSAGETGNSDLDVYLFQDNVNGRFIYVTWLNPVDSPSVHALRLPVTTATVRDSITGGTTTVNDGSDGTLDGHITIQVGGRPLYVEVNN